MSTAEQEIIIDLLLTEVYDALRVEAVEGAETRVGCQAMRIIFIDDFFGPGEGISWRGRGVKVIGWIGTGMN
ncbi:MAG: hypothetical protein NTV68_11755 [Methanomicrobiales archaeon]|nr:hypothetical protein [Methanomicrobiales archaeon]